ncbi:MAG: hypothetical protein E7627_01020 [Ruminococcaceae bacterium]|nr:hypothetical protein [Oscillospiraceae bacterium]
MSFERMLSYVAEYRKLMGDGADRGYLAEYESYALSSVMIRRISANEPEGVSSGGATLYFFPSVSKCTDQSGTEVSFPEYKDGDLCVITDSDGSKKVMRVAEAGYFDDVTKSLSHIKLKLV